MLGKDYDMDKFMSFGVPHKSFPLITQEIDGEEQYVGGLEQLKQLHKIILIKTITLVKTVAFMCCSLYFVCYIRFH